MASALETAIEREIARGARVEHVGATFAVLRRPHELPTAIRLGLVVALLAAIALAAAAQNWWIAGAALLVGLGADTLARRGKRWLLTADDAGHVYLRPAGPSWAEQPGD